ncbi:MAG: hypothetical protein IKG27_02090 [Bacilli bacterium]|nr:hypothetical protein [Bacilli bacterium]
MKKYLFLGFITVITFIIYLVNVDNKVYYLALGNVKYNKNSNRSYFLYVKDYLKKEDILEKFVNIYSKEDVRIADIINSIENNKKTKNITLKNALIKADLITLNISVQDIYDRINREGIDYNYIYDYIDDLLKDIDKLFSLLRQYSKEKIIFIGNCSNINNDDVKDVFDYLNRSYKKMCEKYDIMFIDFDEVNFISDEVIANKIIHLINKNMSKS